MTATGPGRPEDIAELVALLGGTDHGETTMDTPGGTVVPLRRPLGVLDLVTLALSILSHRRWCPDCAPSAYQVAAALQGKGIDELLRHQTPAGGA